MCCVLQEHNYVLLCLFLLAMYEGRSDERRCILQNWVCRMELLAETEMCELDWRCEVVVQTPTFNK